MCLDDDAQGRPLEVLWDLELGARVLLPETTGLGEIPRFDPPRHFAAYLHALKWNCITATDARLFQSPFRSGIRLMTHQLTPLEKALRLPRANLFIADDVGLGKTIEAGLVVQELVLRQRVDFSLVVCPASVCLQWRDEMERKFGLRFEVYDREFVGRRRRERGFGVNPWKTHNRFVISYATLRRPEYFEPLLAHVGGRLKKSLLIPDEAHTAAPASASKYATDSSVTKVVRNLAPRFENRLFLSATPHNGHSNSFSSLLEILDPENAEPAIVALRTAHEDLDRAVLAAYGWSDIPVPPYTAVADDPAFGSFSDAVLDKLFALNTERAEQERLLGETPESKTKRPSTTKPAETKQMSLGGLDAGESPKPKRNRRGS